jgi:hypothetical protein
VAFVFDKGCGATAVFGFVVCSAQNQPIVSDKEVVHSCDGSAIEGMKILRHGCGEMDYVAASSASG